LSWDPLAFLRSSRRSAFPAAVLAAIALLALHPGASDAHDAAALRAKADRDLAAIAASLPPHLRPTPEVVAAYRESYVATVLRPPLPPCGSPEHSPRDHAPAFSGHVRAVADTDTVATWGKVFLDLDEDGELGLGEPGISNVAVSNGRLTDILGQGVQLTGGDGSFSFLTPLPDSRFVFVTVPSGYTATNSFFHRLSAATSPDTAYFGLRVTPETANPVFRWSQISDPHVRTEAENGVEFSADLTEIEGLPLPPAFIVVTGDLVETGNPPNGDTQYQNYVAGLAGHTIPIHSGYGDHDAGPGPLVVEKFEEYLGPTSYSFEYGGVHFVMYNDIHAADAGGLFIQHTWLFLDLVTARARDFPNHDIPIIICKHQMPLRQELDLYNAPNIGVVAAFSGHWHGSRVRLLEGVFDVNTPPSRFAGIDKSSRGFRINDMNDGVIATEYRLGGIADHAYIALPVDGDSVVASSPVEVRVNAYDSQAKMVSGTFRADGPISTGNLPLTADGPWAWRGAWNAASAPDGSYTITATVVPEVGAPLVRTSTVDLVRASVPLLDPFPDWPCFKHDPQGTSFTPTSLTPPLRVAWTRHLGGRNNVESPVVADGKVYVGTSNISTVNEAALNCFSATTGQLLWRFPARTDVKSMPAVANGRVFFSNSIGRLFALNSTDGALLWSTQLGDSLTRWEMTSPTVVGDTVYAGGIPAMSALNAQTGAILWQKVGATGADADFVPSVYSAPAVQGDAVVFTTRGGIFAWNRHTGAPLWTETGQHRSAGITGNLVYTLRGPFGSQTLRAYNLANGAVTHQAAFAQSEGTSAPAITATRIITVHGGNAPVFPTALFQGWLPTLGQELMWNFTVGPAIASSRPYQRTTSSITSTPAVAGSTAYVGADDGRLYAVNIANGAELWRHDFGVPVRSSPAIAGNMLFITTEDGTLYAFVSGTLATAGSGPVAGAPRATRFLGARPNPLTAGGSLEFELAASFAGDERPVPVELRLYDASGRLVRRLVDRKLAPGVHAATWDGKREDGRAAAAGVYFATLETGGHTFRQKITFLR